MSGVLTQNGNWTGGVFCAIQGGRRAVRVDKLIQLTLGKA
jgi:hypothetical protein